MYERKRQSALNYTRDRVGSETRFSESGARAASKLGEINVIAVFNDMLMFYLIEKYVGEIADANMAHRTQCQNQCLLSFESD